MGDFTHLAKGKAVMVDVSLKPQTARVAKSAACVDTGGVDLQKTLSKEAQRELATTIRISAICAAKKTSELIPLCHPLALENVECFVQFKNHLIVIECTAKTSGKTGVEMEAMLGAAIAALTAYDMIKSKCPGATIRHIGLKSKEGGKSGVWKNTTKVMSL
ncbi:MAG: cyclic pyranopterin monophosphate synthase MoaC [Deltaproteobacteria bacterium]|nr:cyclic pyranopterin monophosphate synthase MoaC [Deltaproteobacteria bacterium]